MLEREDLGDFGFEGFPLIAGRVEGFLDAGFGIVAAAALFEGGRAAAIVGKSGLGDGRQGGEGEDADGCPVASKHCVLRLFFGGGKKWFLKSVPLRERLRNDPGKNRRARSAATRYCRAVGQVGVN